MLYVFSFAFQLSGGVILLLWAFRDAQKQIIDSYHPIEAVPQPDDNDMCMMKEARVQEIATNIYRNRFAFGDLCAGYLIAIVAEKTLSNCTAFLSVVITTSIITWLEYHIAEFLAKKNFHENMQVPSSELKKLGVHMVASDKEFNEMLNEVYGEQTNV